MIELCLGFGNWDLELAESYGTVAVPLGFEQLDFTWDLGIGIWNFWET